MSRPPRFGPGWAKYVDHVRHNGVEVSCECVTYELLHEATTLPWFAVTIYRAASSTILQLLIPFGTDGVWLGAGAKFAFCDQEQWARLTKGEARETDLASAPTVPFIMGTAEGCVAEIRAMPALLEAMDKAAGVIVFWASRTGRIDTVAVSLDGYNAAASGAGEHGFQAHMRRRIAARQDWKKAKVDSCLAFLSESGHSLLADNENDG